MLRLLSFTLLLLLLGVAVEVSAGTLEKLQIGVKQKSENCVMKSRQGDRLSMHYTGTLLEDGSKFDSSLDRGQPFDFVLGGGQVIRGWDEGLKDMCVGEKRKLKIPSSLGYGARGAGAKIPPDADLVFEVELLDILNRKPEEGHAEL